MRKIIPAILILLLSLWLILFSSNPTAAQEPNPPPKGPEPTPELAPLETPASAPRFPLNPGLQLKIEPQLLKKLLESQGQPVPFIVYLKAQADLATAAAAVPPTLAGPDPVAQRVAIIGALQQIARSSQAGVLQVLQGGLSGQSSAAEIKPLWIVNAVAAKGALETVLRLAARPEVEIIRLDKTLRINMPPIRETNSVQTTSPEWNIRKIRADLVHNALNLNGAGVVVANIDTGVDWLHPALQAGYRGYTGSGKLPLHTGNWFDATGEGAAYPVDTSGHGTHTMGTMVGQNGVGVAPGAKWIAVKAFDSAGNAQSSWLHSAFQWLLAPNGDPAQAPHVINNSWGSENGLDTEFAADIQALTSAGIVSLFAAGNNGPGASTVDSPGSLNNAFAVGATANDDQIANFSSRGPSGWGKIKPEVAAPGKDIRSTLPGGAYGLFSGTSMAAPHVAGLAALLMQASPALKNNPAAVTQAIISTAVEYGSPVPNNDFGWGRIDAYGAVMSVASVGILRGAVTQAGGAPIPKAVIQIKAYNSNAIIRTSTDNNGLYLQGLAAGTYDVTVSAFGYEPVTIFGLAIGANTTKIQNFSLTLKPTGTLAGTVKDKNNPALGLTATISADGTPATITSLANSGSYTLKLPAGVYTITVVAKNHRIAKLFNVTINEGATIMHNFLLDSAPSILLVDSGYWYQESQTAYYRQALTDALYPFDLWTITKPFATPNDIPPAATLARYNVVIWSSPLDGPGYIGADDEIAAFLEQGGKLLLSGQDVAFFDGGGLFAAKPYLRQYLKVNYLRDDSEIETLNGVAGGPLTGLSFSLNGGTGANNQTSPDVVTIANRDFAGPLLTYGDGGQLAGIYSGLCLPYRTIFLPFGVEGISNRTVRSQVMESAIRWLLQPAAAIGVELTSTQGPRVGNFGQAISHTVRLRNTGAQPGVFDLAIGNGAPYNWPRSSIPGTVSLPGCQFQEIVIYVQLPAAQTWHIADTFNLTARAKANPSLTSVITRTTKTPAPVLLVDDDRWFSFAQEFKHTLTANGIPYDYWYVPKSWVGEIPPSPPLETLQMYPLIVWYTGYDWFQPLTPPEEERLIAYLKQGGRLFLSSQDFLYRHLLYHNRTYTPFVQNYLGVQSHTEDFTSTLTIGQAGNPVGAHLGPYSFTFPPNYTNWTDGLNPTTTARPATVGQAGQINGLINTGPGSGGRHWQTLFLSYGPELLAAPDRTRLMQRGLGWLSWLGSSTIQPNISATLDNATITYTAVISNSGWHNLSTAYFTATFPIQLTPSFASPELALVDGQFTWNGPLARNQSKVLTYTATLAGDLPLGTLVSQTSWLAYPEHGILFDRVTDLYVNFPDLNHSTMTVTPAHGLQAKDLLTYTIVLKNDGLVNNPVVTLTNTLPHLLELVSLDTPSQGALVSSGKTLTWTTALAKNEVATLTYRAVISYEAGSDIKNIAYIQDGLSPTLALTARAAFKRTRFYLPVIWKN